MKRLADREIQEAERILRESRMITSEAAKEYGTIETAINDKQVGKPAA